MQAGKLIYAFSQFHLFLVCVLNNRVKEPTLIAKMVKNSISRVVFCLFSPAFSTTANAVDTRVLSNAALLSGRVVYFRLYLEQRLGPSRGFEGKLVL